MVVSGQQYKKLYDALIDAFPNKASLEQMLAFELDKNLDTIVGGSNLTEVVFILIKTAEADGWLEDLIDAARKSNPTNLQLTAIAEELLPSYYPGKITQRQTILLLAVNPTNTSRLRLDEEVREIQAVLKLSKHREEFEIISLWVVRLDDLRRALLDHKPQIVHFLGHGTGDEGLALENNSGQMQLVSALSLTRVFKLFPQIECVLLNACYSEVQAEAINQHIDYVIGINNAIGDKAAIEFAVGFYEALGENRSYEEAFNFGCVAIKMEGIAESSNPVLLKRKTNSVNIKKTATIKQKKILFLLANPRDTSRLRLDEEVRETQIALRNSRRRREFQVLQRWGVRPRDMRSALLEHQPQIVHFSGHGAGTEGIALENDHGQLQFVTTEALAKLFEFFQDKIECVFLNAEYSQVQAEAISQYVDYVIGYNNPISDKAAIEFTVNFYTGLGNGKTYEQAFKFGCAAIALANITESAIPVLTTKKDVQNNYFYSISLTTSQASVSLGLEIEVLISLKSFKASSNNDYVLQIPQYQAIANELNILLNAPAFQLNCENTASLPLDTDIAQETQTATFHLTALRPGTTTITAELYRGDTFETTLETQVQVADFDEATFTPQRITTQPRLAPQADFIFRIQTIGNETNSTCKFQYQLKSFRFPSRFPDNNIYTSRSLSSTWIEQVRGLLVTTLENISGSLSQERKSRLISLGQYLFNHLFPTELQGDIRSLIPRNSTFTILILTNQNTSIPWELLHDGQRFFAERFIIGRWLSELNDTRPYEFPVGAVNVAHYANVEQPELWATLLQPPGAPPPQPLPEGVLHDSTEAMRGLHLIRYSQPEDVNNLHNAPVRLDNPNDAEDIETKIRPAKLNLRRNRPFVTLSYMKTDTPELTELQQTWTSAFIHAGCSGFTGSLWAVEPSVEAAFISSFYNSLWAGASLGEAFYTSRQLARAVAPDSLDWLAYVLFGDPMARPYLPVEGKGYAVVEPIGREIEEPLPPNVPIRFRLSLRRTPPVWHQERVIEVAENLTFENLQVHVKTMGLQVTPDSPIEMNFAPNGNYLGWFTLVAPPEMVDSSALVQVYFMDGEIPIHSLMFSLNIENNGGE
ncbi:CHAT domain-containing protein [Calothrix sp. CCY 0018]|uniref:CHAT domain-containing protein n=1 Tax=Calothrix sp. CCY 0018 TaxID=3103864 RepID=UPI0039C698AA